MAKRRLRRAPFKRAPRIFFHVALYLHRTAHPLKSQLSFLAECRFRCRSPRVSNEPPPFGRMADTELGW
jgi:hypothetical protein